MKRIIYAFSLIAILIVSSAEAQSSSKILDRYRKAVGGNAVKKVKSTSVTGTLKASGDLTGRFMQRSSFPDRIRTDIEVGDFKSSECYNGKSAWRMDARGLRTLIGPETKRLRLEALLANNNLRDLSKSRIFAQAPVKTSVDGKDAFAVEFTREEARVKLFFDARTYLIIKQERDGADGLEETFFDDYRAVNKVMEPFAIRIRAGGKELSVAVETVEHNRAADDLAYRYPQAEGDKPLPDVEVLMRTLIANQEKIEALRDRYTFRRTETSYKLDDKGRVKDEEVRVSEVTPVAGRFVRRLISKNGKPLAEKEQAEEDRRVQKAVEELLERKEKQDREKERDREKGKEEEDDDDVSILKILRLSEVTSVRRETFRGHQVIAFDFEPKKGVKPKNRAESLLSKLAGTLWIDEGDSQIARLEARFVESFKIGGGLFASVSPSTAVAIEQQKINNEIWMPSYIEANLSARIFLLAKLSRSIKASYSDYKKYSIDNKYEIQKPK